MRRADRLFEIIQVLRQARGPISAQTIGQELDVSKRTIYRDIASLIGQRVPISGEAGIGYVLARGFDMPPLMLTEDEIDAAALGAHWVASRGEPELAAAAQRLLAKIEAVVPEHLGAALRDPATSVAPITLATEAIGTKDLRAAIRLRRKLHIGYRDAQGNETDRIVWPVLVGYRDSGRILAAWCEFRHAFRYFRTDQMISAEMLSDAIPERARALRKRWEVAMNAERAKYANQER